MNLPLKQHPARLARLLFIIPALLLLGGQAAVAQSGADLDVSISGARTVRYGENITYTITATNIGDETATGVQLQGWVPDWFNFVGVECPGGTPGPIWGCDYPDLAPGGSVSMTITVEACCGEKHMFEIGSAYAANDINQANNEARIKVNFTGPNR